MIASLLAADPLLDTSDWWWQVLAIVVAKVLVVFVVGLVGTMFMVWFERKIVSGMQNRIGPNKAGPVRPAADPRRRHQAVLQGRPAAREGRQVGVPARPVPRASSRRSSCGR